MHCCKNFRIIILLFRHYYTSHSQISVFLQLAVLVCLGQPSPTPVIGLLEGYILHHRHVCLAFKLVGVNRMCGWFTKRNLVGIKWSVHPKFSLSRVCCTVWILLFQFLNSYFQWFLETNVVGLYFISFTRLYINLGILFITYYFCPTLVFRFSCSRFALE